MSNILPKIDYADGQILHGSDLNASNEVIKAGVDDNFARIQELDLEKQDNLDVDVDYLTPSTASETYETKKGVDDFYVTNDEKIKLSNTSGVNTGDETKASIETKLGKASATNNGYLSKEDHTLFNDKQEKLVSGTNIKTINGNSVLGSGNITIAGGSGSGSGSGDVVGPSSSINLSIPIFDGETGKIIKDSGFTFNYIEAAFESIVDLFEEDFSLKEDKLPETPAEPESKFLNGNKQWAPIVVGSGGYASNIYMTNIVSDLVPAYKKSSSINDTLETIVSATCNNNEVLAATYLYDTALATEIVDAGSWRFNLFSAIDAVAGDSKFKVEVFERLSNGTEIVLFSAYSSTIENRVGYEGYMYNMIETIQPSFNVNLTSRLGHRIYATTTAAGDRILSYKIGDGSASYLNTPLALRHSQLRDKNGESDYQHITQTEKDKLGEIDDIDARLTTAEGEIDTAQTDINNAEAVIGNETDTYSASSTYALGSLVIYNNLLYKCTTAITVAEAWTVGHWSQVSLLDITKTGSEYSKSEKIVGKWYNGKPIYRKVITFTFPATSPTDFTVAPLNNVAEIISLRGIADYTFPFPSSWNMQFDIGLRYNGTTIVGRLNWSSYTSKPGIVIVDYTKTTD